MLTLTRIILCLIVSLTLTGACAAQSRGGSKSGSRKAKPQPAQEPEKERAVIAESVSERAEVRQVGQAQVRYYHVPDEKVSASIALPEVYRGQGQTMDFEFDVIVDSKALSKPDVVHLTFNNHSSDKDYLPFKADRLVLEADGRQFSFRMPPMWVGLKIDFASFEQIANGKSVKGRLGRHTFELTESHREALRDLLRAIGVPAKTP